MVTEDEPNSETDDEISSLSNLAVDVADVTEYVREVQAPVPLE